MKNLVMVLLGVGIGAGVLWYKLDKVRAPAAVVATDEPATATTAGPVPTGDGSSASQVAPPAIPLVNLPAPMSAADIARRARIRETVKALHPDLATDVELTTEQADLFLDLLARQQDEIAAVRGANNVRLLEMSAEAERAAMLGEAYPRWQQYESDAYERDQVDQLQKMLVTQDMQLSDEEINPLVDALAAEQKRLTQELVNASQTRGQDAREMLQLQLDRADINNRRLMDVASRHLKPQQLALYEQLLQQRVRGMRLKLRAMDLASER